MKNKDLFEKYQPKLIEPKWQKKWEEEELYRAIDFDKRKKFYTLIEFPYPSAAGFHVGNARSWSAMDAYSRKKRMEGFNVLYPIGWDAFGLPAENYALKMKIHPSISVSENIANFKKQIKLLGLSFDWSREVDTTDPKYYKWTQWIFLKFFEKGLAYRADVPVNWCPSCKTNLADEEVLSDGTHERCGTPTEERLQKQWLLKITEYADRLIEDLKLVDYSSRIAQQQINWIGRKTGINITYSIIANDGDSSLRGSETTEAISNRQKDRHASLAMTKDTITCFTTRPDTNFGATFIVIGPEHPFVNVILNEVKDLNQNEMLKQVQHNKRKIRDDIVHYVEKAKKKSEIDRIAEGRKKTGVFTGFYAINNLNGKKMPIWVSDFVLGNVGTGAVVGVPGHDIRDFEFAQGFNLPIIRVVVGKDKDTSSITHREQVQEEEGTMINSDFLNGLDIHAATEKIMDYFEEKGWGEKITVFHLRDWVFSRQHYWGEPIPIIHCKKCGAVPVPEKDLPVELPYLEKYEPAGTGESPLAQAADWLKVECPKCGGIGRRETDTMPNWAGSNWYYLRYLDPQNDKALADQSKMKYWMPVDLYQGGFEHTTLHLLYSRFVYKFLYDIGAVPTPEPYAKRRSHGIVLGTDGRKMSKSFGNIINPDDIVNKFGADTLRVYEMFMGPFDQAIAWSEEGVEGCFRFLKRVWSLSLSKVTDEKMSKNLLVSLNKTIKKVGDDIEVLKFNTAVASMMEFVNEWQRDEKGLNKKELKKFLLIFSPFAPHIAEELFFKINTDLKTDPRGSVANQWKSIHEQSWPSFDKKYLEEKEVTIVVQVNGRVRDAIKYQISNIKYQKLIEERAKENERVKRHLEGKSIKKIVYVEGKIINFVVND